MNMSLRVLDNDCELIIALCGKSMRSCMEVHHRMVSSYWKMGFPWTLKSQTGIVLQGIQALTLPAPWWGMKSYRHWVGFKRQIGCYISFSRKWCKSWLLKGTGWARMAICPLCIDSAFGCYGFLLGLGGAKEAMLRCAAALPILCGHLPSD